MRSLQLKIDEIVFELFDLNAKDKSEIEAAAVFTLVRISTTQINGSRASAGLQARPRPRRFLS